jgi:hypothetical protein
MDTLEEFEQLREDARSRWVADLPNRGLWGGNGVPRGEIRPSYRKLDAADPHLPIPHSTMGSNIAFVGFGVVEDLRHYVHGVPERIFTKS